MNLKIGYDAKRLFNNETGLGNYSRNLLRSLAKYYPTCEYHLFTPSISNERYKEEFSQAPFTIHTPPSAYDRILWRTVRQSKQVNRLGLDIYHGLSHELPYGLHSSIKTVVTFHDLIYEMLPNSFSWYDTKMYRWKYASSAKKADRIFAISKQTKTDLLTQYRLSEDKIKLTYQTLDDAYIGADEGYDSGNYILYVGSIIARKNLLHIIKALGKIPIEQRVPLKVIGRGGAYESQCRAAVKQLDLEQWVSFEGQVANDELMEIYRRAIVTILPSSYEGFGIPIIESLSQRTPVITSKHSAMAEAAGPGGLLINPNSLDELLDAVKKLLMNTALQKELAHKGHQYIHEHFTPKETADIVMKGYINLAQSMK